MTRSVKPDYGEDALAQFESSAYDAGYERGYAGKDIGHSYFSTAFPNAYHRGYWDGVGDMEKEHA